MKRSTTRLLAATMALLSLCFAPACESDDDGGGGSLGGTWRGTAAGRPLTMTLSQNGTSLSGNYTLENPTFGEGLDGSASSAEAPASATLSGGGDRQFRITFSSANALSGGFYKGETMVGAVQATK